MNSAEILDHLYEWAKTRGFTAPYGILTGEGFDTKKKKYLSLTFGRARTLDATVKIYNRNFMLLTTNVHGLRAYRSVEALKESLDKL